MKRRARWMAAWALMIVGLAASSSNAEAAESDKSSGKSAPAAAPAPAITTAAKTPPPLSAPELATPNLPPHTASKPSKTAASTIPPQDARDPSVPLPAPGPVKFTGTPSAEMIRKVIRSYTAHLEATEGSVNIPDYTTRHMRALKLKRLHDEVGRRGDTYYVGADMTDAATSDEVDVDFDISTTGSQIAVANIRIHKINGKLRYNYDAQGNLVPL